MANFTYTSAFALPANTLGSSSSAPVDDDFDNACSICLEPFTAHDPVNVTSCKHEYHLQCILEWSQRSKECPICSQKFVLIDPASQKLLDAIEKERFLMSRSSHPSLPRNNYHSRENFSLEGDAPQSDDPDERFMQLVAEAVGQACLVTRRERQRSSGLGSGSAVYSSPISGTNMHEAHSLAPESGRNANFFLSSGPSPGSGVPSPVTPDSYRLISGDPSANSDERSNVRVFSRHSPPQSPQSQSSFPQSIKSKLSAASAKYKESISKSSQELKDKLLAHNNSVKELSRGVQREMNAGLAGFARLIERLELASKRSGGSASDSVHSSGTFNNSSKGKHVEDNIAAQIHIVNSGSPPISTSSPVRAGASQTEGPQEC